MISAPGSRSAVCPCPAGRPADDGYCVKGQSFGASDVNWCYVDVVPAIWSTFAASLHPPPWWLWPSQTRFHVVDVHRAANE